MTRSNFAMLKLPLLGDHQHPHHARRLIDRKMNSHQAQRIVCFDLETTVLDQLVQVLPGWQIDMLNGVTLGTLAEHWDPDAADLLLVSVRDHPARTLGLCRFLSSCTNYSFNAREWKMRNQKHHKDQLIVKEGAPLFVLAPTFTESFLQSAKKAGAENFVHLPLDRLAMERMVLKARRTSNPLSARSPET